MRKIYRNAMKSVSLLLFLMTICLTSFAQDRTITGTIKDASGLPLPGVNVIKRGTTVGTATDSNGKFSIEASDNDVLLLTFIGYDNAEIKVGSQTDISYTMIEDIATLQEIVVVGYGSIQKSFLTTSVSTLDQKDVKNLPVAGIDQAIQGRLAGVTVNTNGGQPGGGISVRVRGVTSVNGSQPLYVIDGVPIGADVMSLDQNFLGGGNGQTTQSVLSTLNPADIESIEVLKDASAQAIYGSRAANGVILVTTKKGKKGKGKISYDTYYGVSVVPKKLPVMNLRQLATFQNSVMDEINATEVAAGIGTGNRKVNPAFANPDVLGEGTDWQDAAYQTGSVQSHNLGFSGGTDNVNYLMSAGAFNQKGILVGTDFTRYSLRANIDGKIKDWLKGGFSTNLSRSDQQIGLSGAFDAVTSVVLYNHPAAPIRDFNGDYSGPVQIGGQSIGNTINPIAQATLRDVRAVNTRAFGAIYGEITFFKGLSLRNELNYDFNLRSDKAFQPEEGTLPISKLREQRTNSIAYVLKNYFTYNGSIAQHNFNATLGHEAQYNQFDYIQASRQKLKLNLPSLNAGQGGNDSNETIGAGAGRSGLESFFGRINYNYANKYAVSFTMRADGSSNFGPNKRWGYFPAASASWTVTNESFAKDMSFLNYFKVRGGVGSVGNQNPGGQNLYTANVNLVTISPFGNASIPANVPNPNLSWEAVKTYNVGLDASLFEDGIVDVTLDVYKKVTTNMFLPNQFGAFSGLGTNFDDITTPVTNGGQMTNTGIDITVTSHNIQKTDFSWSTTVVFSQYKNTLDFLNTDQAIIQGKFDEYGTKTTVAVTAKGHPIGSFYGYVTDGLYTTTEELNSLQTELDVEPTGLWFGDIKYKDVVPDGVLNDKDVTFIGNPNPDFTLGITNDFAYKGFDLKIFLYGSFGADIFNYTRRQTESLSTLNNNQLTTVFDRYTETHTDATMPRYNEWHKLNTRVSDRYIEDGTYLRIQNVQFGYTLPNKLLNSIGVNAFRVYFSAQNLATFTNYSGYDPELGVLSGGVATANGIVLNVDNGGYPNPRTFTIGANIEF